MMQRYSNSLGRAKAESMRIYSDLAEKARDQLIEDIRNAIRGLSYNGQLEIETIWEGSLKTSKYYIEGNKIFRQDELYEKSKPKRWSDPVEISAEDIPLEKIDMRRVPHDLIKLGYKIETAQKEQPKIDAK